MYCLELFFLFFGHHPSLRSGSLRSEARCSLGPSDSLTFVRDPLRIADARQENKPHFELHTFQKQYCLILCV